MEILDLELWEMMQPKALQADFRPLGQGVLLVVLTAVECTSQSKQENIIGAELSLVLYQNKKIWM